MRCGFTTTLPQVRFRLSAVDSLDGGGWVENELWPAHPETNDPCRGDRLALVEKEPKAHPATNHAEFQGTLFVYGTVQPCGNWLGTILRVAGNANGTTAETFDAVMAVLGLDVYHRSPSQTRAINNFSRCHKASLLNRMYRTAIGLQEVQSGCKNESSRRAGRFVEQSAGSCAMP